MSIINISDLTFAYDGSYDNIFNGVSFQLDTDWKLGFIGRNGRGKTTFFHLLTGKYEYSGTIKSAVGFDYFPFEVDNKTALTLDIIGGIARGVPNWQINRELSLLDVGENVLHRPFCTLSNGEQTKVLLAALFLKENNFLLIDEPTNHLDADARTAVCEYLQSKKGFIMVSHDRDILDNCVDHILSINKTNIELQKGNFSSWLVNKERLDNFETAENERLQKDIKKLSEAAKRTADWSNKVEKSKKGGGKNQKSGLAPDKGYIGHKAAKMMKRSKSIEARRQSALAEKSGLLKNIENNDSLKISPLIYHSDRLITLDKISLFYNGKAVCENINFTVGQGERIALCGN